MADPTRSRPSSSGGIARAWISVSVVKPISATALRVFSQTLSAREANVALLRMDSAIPDPGTADNCSFHYPSLTIHVQAGQQQLHCAHAPKYFATGNRLKERVYVHTWARLRAHTHTTEGHQNRHCSEHSFQTCTVLTNLITSYELRQHTEYCE